MNPDTLFLHRCDKMVALLQSHTEADYLDLAAIIRQLLLDKHALADTANRNRLPITFHIGALKELPPGAKNAVYILMDAIDPEEFHDLPPGMELASVVIPRDQIGGHPIAQLGTTFITVKDAVRFAANIAGGVHHDPRTTHDYQAEAAMNAQATFNGIPSMARMMRPLAVVFLRGLDPLITDVRQRLSPSPDRPA